MTKVEAIKKVLEDNEGVAVWSVIYNQIEQYYPNIKTSKEWKAGIRGVLYREIGTTFKMLDQGVIALINFNETNLVLPEDLSDTTKTIETKIRIGQDRFRKSLLKKIKYCPITGISDNRLLLASHIKPWALSSNEERLDIHNGLIFSPLIDKLFDSGLISFENDKTLIISSSISMRNIHKLGITPNIKYQKLPIESRIKYIEFHRENIFLS